ncbi:MAG: IPT/TIG domain-containing protein [Candidatus Sericytochromatia bacterium]|nr:IPT/TIG domain-containing protein [Candidatus Tanganyikabacteria bacterium]
MRKVSALRDSVGPAAGRLAGPLGAWLALVVSFLPLSAAGCALAGLGPRLAGSAPQAASGAGPAAIRVGPAAILAAPAAILVGPASVPASTSLALPAGKGLLEIAVRWPARSGQVIPDSTSRVRFDVATAGGSFVASGSVARPGGASTSTASFELDGGSYKLDAAAQAGPAESPTNVATASAPFAVVAGARTSLPLTLGASYRPAVTGFDKAWGLPGDSVTLSGSNLGLSWASTPSVKFSAGGASVSAVVDTVESGSVRFSVPSGAKTGPISVAVDGVATTSATFTVPDPALWALSTPLASAGDTIYLDGGFGQSATVTFPGNQTVNADVLGPGRARVVVPAGATAGNLTITTGSTTSAPLAFRAPTFSLGLGTLFGRHYDQAAGGRQMPSLGTPRMRFGAAVIGDYLYVFGGTTTGSGYASTTERAAIDSAGALGRFQSVAGANLSMSELASAIIGQYLYVYAGGNFKRAAISGGSLGAFQAVAVSLVKARNQPGFVVIGRYLYVIGITSEVAPPPEAAPA